ncbi:MAG: C39 family peptidase [Caldilineaceae bacterium]|nr:C39 family peptidase [Caldilineaceae bacterium]
MKFIFIPASIAFVLATVTSSLLIVAGCWRYGGPEGVLRRAQAEWAAHQPHPEFAPTPLPLSIGAGNATQTSTQAIAGAQPAKAAMATANGSVAFATVEITAPVETVAAPQTATPAPTTTPAPLHQPAAPSVELTGFSHEWQTWNNCGPATLAMNLSYFGSTLDQAAIGAVLRQYEDDKNVNPEELVEFAASQGYMAQQRVNGSAELMKLLLSNGIPVLIETWHEPEPNDGMGHYRLLTGYSDADQHWIAFDSYDTHGLINADPNAPYRGIRLPYAETEALWRVFNRTHLLIYKPEQAALVQSIVGDALEPAIMWQQSRQQAETEIAANSQDAFAWFNLGSSWLALGDYAQSAAAYDQARQLGLPWRMFWYQFGAFEAYLQTGRAQEVVALADATIATTKSIEEIYYWRGRGLAALGDMDAARRAWQQAIELNPDFAEAAELLAANP